MANRLISLPLIATGMLIVPTLAAAADAPGSEEELQALMSLLEEETEVATNIRANADYLPGMISVLHGEDLLAQGRQTVFDALSLVPGVQTTRSNRGNMIVLIRGLRTSAFGGNALIMLNSVPMISATRAQASTVLSMPLGQVDRIEVTRGPGSSVHGEYAQTGVINVITHKQGRRLFAEADSHGSTGIGGYVGGVDNDSGAHWYANVSGWSSDGAGVNSGPDAYTAGGLGYAPGEVDDREGNRFALLGFEVNDFALNLNWMEYSFGNFFGGSALSPPGLGLGSERQWSLNLRQGFQPSESLSMAVEFNAMDYRRDDNSHIQRPAGAVLGAPGIPPVVLPVDQITEDDYAERRYDLKGSLRFSGVERHDIQLELGYSDIELYASSTTTNVLPPTTVLPTPQTWSGRRALLPAGQTRGLRYALLQDDFSPHPDVHLTGSVRYDDYTDVGSHLSPRLAAVWQVEPSHAIKAQYSQAIRPPTFAELYSATRLGGVARRPLELQVQESYELGYIYRQVERVGRATLFRTRIDSPTNPTRPPGNFASGPSIHLRGMELEWSSPLTTRWRLDSNLSYLDADETANPSGLAGSYDWLANLMLEGRLTSRWQIYLNLRAVGDQVPDGVVGGSIPGYRTLDVGFSGNDVFDVRGLGLRFGVRNLFDDGIVYTALPGTYVEGLPQPGREWWMHLAYDL